MGAAGAVPNPNPHGLPMTSLSLRGTFAAALSLSSVGLPGQCSTQAVSLPELSGMVVYATKQWDPDGAGPAQPLTVVAGTLRGTGQVSLHGLAAYDPLTGSWSSLGAAFDGTVRCLATMPNGDLIAGGTFTKAGTLVVNRIARWNGSTWSSMGSGIGGPGINGPVFALAVRPNGDLVAGGNFSTGSDNIARWNGSNWLGLGSGLEETFAFPFADVRAVTTLPNGDIVAGGSFTKSGLTALNRVARWDGTAWQPMGAGFSSDVLALATLPNGQVVAAGENTVRRWYGTAWGSHGPNLSGTINVLEALPNGDVLAGGRFTLSGVGFGDGVAKASGLPITWSRLGGAFDGFVFAAHTLPNGNVLAGGDFSTAAGGVAYRVAEWNGSSWSGPSNPPFSGVAAMTVLPNGTVFSGGDFTRSGHLGGSIPLNYVARLQGAAWGSASSGMNAPVRALATPPNGEVVAGGTFTTAGGQVANRIARWNGSSWSSVGTGLDGGVEAVVVDAGGGIVAGGDFSTAGGFAANRIALWDTMSWSPLGSGMDATVRAIATLPNGDLIAGGDFGVAGGVTVNHIARWNGAAWSALHTGVDGTVLAIARLPNGHVVAGGDFTMAGGVVAQRVARWDGSTWSPLGTGVDGKVRALTVLPTGDLVVGGDFTAAGGTAASRLARWDGTNWWPIGLGTDGSVQCLATLPTGDLIVGGTFSSVDGISSIHIGRVNTTCPASVQPYGSGCAGPGGTVQLVADTLPWTSSAFRVTATGLGPVSIGVALIGFQSFASGTFPLSTLPVAGGGVGCDLLNSSEILDFFTPGSPISGQATYTLSLASAQMDPSLPGLVFHVQAAELDGSGPGWIGTYSSNGLTCTVGSY